METMLLNKNRLKNQLVKVLKMDEIVAEKITSVITEDLDLIRIISPIDFLDHCNSVLPLDEKVLRTLFLLTTLESMVASKKTKTEKVKLVTSAVSKYLTPQEKGKLLGGFIFTDTYKFGEGRFGTRHLMFQDAVRDEHFNKFDTANSEYCSTSDPYLCRCVEWVNSRKNYDMYILELVGRLNEMRGALLHEGFRILWFPDYEHDPSVAMYSATLVDAHPTTSDPDVFRTYESGLDSTEFFEWIKKVMREYLKEKVGI